MSSLAAQKHNAGNKKLANSPPSLDTMSSPGSNKAAKIQKTASSGDENASGSDPRVFVIDFNDKKKPSPPLANVSNGNGPATAPRLTVPEANKMKLNKSENFQKQEPRRGSIGDSSLTPTGSVDKSHQQQEANTINRELNLEQLNQELLKNSNNFATSGPHEYQDPKSHNSSITLASSQMSSTNSSRIQSPNKTAGGVKNEKNNANRK
jgi:hypothetical protein